jgi:two-component system cell cycle sensor histidine kinase/response regulator CckA
MEKKEKTRQTGKKFQRPKEENSGVQEKRKGKDSAHSPFDALLMTSREAIIIFKPTGEIVDINQAAADLLGYSMREMLGLKFQELHGTQEVSQKFQKQMGQEESIRDLQIKLRKKDGTVMECQLNMSAWKARNGRLAGYAAIVHEVQDGTVLEKTPGQSVESWLALYEEAPFGISVMRPDRRFEYINPKFTEILGYTIEDIPDKDTWFRKVYPDKEYQKHVISHWEEDFAGKVKIGGTEPRIFRARCKNGKDKIIDIRSVDLKDGKQYLIYEDITTRANAEDALLQSEERYRTLVEESFDGIYAQMEEKVVFCNRRLHDMLGYEQGEIVGLDHWRVYHYDYQELIKKQAVSLMRGEEIPHEQEVKLLRKDGTEFYGEIIARAITFDGRPGVQVWVRDVSKRKKAEKALRDSEERYRTLVETMRVGLCIIDEDGISVYANDNLCKMWGYSLDEILGRPVIDFLDEEDKQTWEKQLERRKEGAGKPYEMKWMSKDGGRVHTIMSPTPLFDVDGNFIGSFAVVTDITERKYTEEALRESEEKYRTILENIEDGYYEVDLKGNLTFFNDSLCKILGYTYDELMGMKSRTYFDRESLRPVFETFYQVFQTGRPAKLFEGEVIRKDGAKRIVETSVTLIKDTEGNPIGFRGIGRDITERRRAEEEREQLEARLMRVQKMEALGTLAGGIAHNFNNLLMGIQGNTSLMLMESDPERPNYEKLKAIERLVKSGSRLTGQLVGYTRGGRYQVKLIDLNRLMTETSDTFGVTKKEIRIHKELTEGLRRIDADQGQIEQIFMNLYVNAADAMPKGGDLFLSTKNVTHKEISSERHEVKKGKYVMFSVRDTGDGMDKATQERIFDPFFTSKGHSKGTGLGLASVQGIVMAHKGHIDVESKLGHGTTFKIYLPATEREMKEKRNRTKRIKVGKETILLADDEAELITVGDQMLKALGYKVLTARGGKGALQLYKKNSEEIDLVLLDMIMPDMGGAEVYERLKEINPNVKVLLSSGYSINGKASEILKSGCDGFIQKPFDIKDLSHRIRQVLGQ